MGYATLPQLDRPFLTDAGLETDLIFNRGIDLPYFASVTLLATEDGKRALKDYFRGFLDLAARMGSGLVLESATWRAGPDWAEPLGLSVAGLDQLNRDAIALLHALRDDYRDAVPDVVISGCLGPRGDGYDPGRIMSVEEAEAYHRHQAGVLYDAGVDMLSAITMTNILEAIGIARAAQVLGAPAAISFTVETNGRLPTGDTLADAVKAVDDATGAAPAYYMINCAHPAHFTQSLDPDAAWTSRIKGLRANASRCSHAELDAMTELDIGDPDELAALHRDLRVRLPGINVLGGCCGTDLRHVTLIAEACLSPAG